MTGNYNSDTNYLREVFRVLGVLELSDEELTKLKKVKAKYNKGELSENKMKKVSKRKP